MRRAVGFLAVLAALASVVWPIAAWTLGWMIILTAAGGEYQVIRQDDKPSINERLQFGDWKNGAGLCRPSHITNTTDEAVIVSHRVGQINGRITRFTYYEAIYRMPDGRLRVAHARGPIPLISHHWDSIVTVTAGCVLLSVALFFVEHGLREK